MLPFKKILAPTDFSASSNQALRCACELAKKFDAELILAHVYSPIVSIFPDGYFALPYGIQKDLNIYLEAAINKARLEAEHLMDRKVKVELLPGRDFDEIARYAKSEDCDLIVIGSHGRGAVSRFFLGSVTERVLRQASCHVFVVHSPPEAKPAERLL
jgi:nucleotide-binding universal stress UspA family protein